MDACSDRFMSCDQPVGPGSALASRLVLLRNFQSDASREELARVINGMLNTVDSIIFVPTTPFLYGESPGTSLTRAYRTALWHVCINRLAFYWLGGRKLTASLVYRGHRVEIQRLGGRDIRCI